jgi:ferritin
MGGKTEMIGNKMEESSVDQIVQNLKMAGDSAGALLKFDHNLGKRKSGASEEGED